MTDSNLDPDDDGDPVETVVETTVENGDFVEDVLESPTELLETVTPDDEQEE